jgi:hypothetical protein
MTWKRRVKSPNEVCVVSVSVSEVRCEMRWIAQRRFFPMPLNESKYLPCRRNRNQQSNNRGLPFLNLRRNRRRRRMTIDRRG